jgi:hypothetical protein
MSEATLGNHHVWGYGARKSKRFGQRARTGRTEQRSRHVTRVPISADREREAAELASRIVSLLNRWSGERKNN